MTRTGYRPSCRRCVVTVVRVAALAANDETAAAVDGDGDDGSGGEHERHGRESDGRRSYRV